MPHAPRPYTVTDDFGRRTHFKGNKLAAESTDTADGRKPQWTDINVWRTEAGNFVVQRTTHYRIRHTRDTCSRADGYELIPPTQLDTYPCPTCNKAGALQGGHGQASRIVVESYLTPQDLIDSFKDSQGRYSSLARTILADVAEQDDRVDEIWNNVVVP